MIQSLFFFINFINLWNIIFLIIFSFYFLYSKLIFGINNHFLSRYIDTTIYKHILGIMNHLKINMKLFNMIFLFIILWIFIHYFNKYIYYKYYKNFLKYKIIILEFIEITILFYFFNNNIPYLLINGIILRSIFYFLYRFFI